MTGGGEGAPAAGARPWCRQKVGAALSLLFSAVTIVTLGVLNPFGLTSAADDESRDSFYSLTAPFYDSQAQDAITVVVVDDEALRKTGETYPPSFNFYASLLRNLVMAKPRAVFLDFLFLDARGDPGDAERFARLISSMRDVMGIPVYVALSDGATRPERCGTPGTETIGPLRNAGQPAHVAFEPGLNRVPLTLERVCPPTRPDAVSLALYKEFCRSTGACRSSAEGDRAFAGPLSIRWAEGQPGSMGRLGGTSDVCFPAQADFGRRIGRSFERLVAGLTYGLGGRARLLDGRCFFHDTVMGEFLINPQALREVAEMRGIADPAAFQRSLFADRIVLIGARYNGINDFARTPVYGTVPGVFAHAMALDNLITYGANHYRPWPELSVTIFGGKLGLDAVLEAVLVFAVAGGSVLLERGARPPVGQAVRRHWLASRPVVIGSATLMVLLLSIGATTVASVVFRFEPINWIGLLLAGVLIVTPVIRDAAADRIARAGERATDIVRSKGAALGRQNKNHG